MDLLTHTPRFAAPDAERVARDLYGLTASAAPLTSERDQNFLLTARSGGRWVLKFANALDDRTFLEAQQLAMTLVADRTGLCQDVVPLASGEHLGETTGPDGGRHFVRLVPFINGTPAGDVRRHSA